QGTPTPRAAAAVQNATAPAAAVRNTATPATAVGNTATPAADVCLEAAADPEGAGRPAAARSGYSLYFLGDYPDQGRADKYGHLLAAAEFADRAGLRSLW